MANRTDSPTLDELFREAFSTDEVEKQVVEPVVSEEVVEEEGEQSEDMAVPAKLSDLFEQPAPADSIAPTVDLAQKVTLPDGTESTIQDLINGNLMRKDYTKKTQVLSAAKELYEMLQEDPEATVAALAQKVGLKLADDYAVQQLRNKKDVSNIVKGDDDRLKELVAEQAKTLFEEFRQNDPAMRDQETRAAQAKVQAEFDRIQTIYGTELDADDRNALLGVAIKTNDPNLEFIYLRAQAALNAKKAEAERVNAGRVRRNAATPIMSKADALLVKPKTLDEAWKLAELQLATV